MGCLWKCDGAERFFTARADAFGETNGEEESPDASRKGTARMRRTKVWKEGLKVGSGRGGPKKCYVFLDLSEIGVAGEKRGFGTCGESGGEAIDVGEFVIGFEFRGLFGEVIIGIH
jgi:hypothetical protein